MKGCSFIQTEHNGKTLILYHIADTYMSRVKSPLDDILEENGI